MYPKFFPWKHTQKEKESIKWRIAELFTRSSFPVIKDLQKKRKKKEKKRAKMEKKVSALSKEKS